MKSFSKEKKRTTCHLISIVIIISGNKIDLS